MQHETNLTQSDLMSFNDVATYLGRTRQKIHEYKSAYPDLFKGLTVHFDANKPSPKAYFEKEAFMAWARQYPNAVTAIRMGKPGLAVVFTKRTFSPEEGRRLLTLSHCGSEYKRLMANTPGACATTNANRRKDARAGRPRANHKEVTRRSYGTSAPDGMLTVHQVADLLGLAYKTIGKKAKRGDFGAAAKQVNGMWYFDEAEIKKVKLVGREKPRKKRGSTLFAKQRRHVLKRPATSKVGPKNIHTHMLQDKLRVVEAEIERLMQKHEQLEKERRKIALEEFLDALMKGRAGQIIRKHAGSLSRATVIAYLSEHIDALSTLG